MATSTCLKRSSCGDVVQETRLGETRIVRDIGKARAGCRWIARHLARREARALTRLDGIDGVPALIGHRRNCLIRSFVPGRPMHVAEPHTRAFYRDALTLLRRIHRAGVAHNDLAKEANWICRGHDRAAIVDFQLAFVAPRRGRWFRVLAREDLRHLLKHKAHYRPDLLTARQQALLANPSVPTRAWRMLFKPGYRLLTRGLLRWPERPGAAERERPV